MQLTKPITGDDLAHTVILFSLQSPDIGGDLTVGSSVAIQQHEASAATAGGVCAHGDKLVVKKTVTGLKALACHASSATSLICHF